ncbi:MAG: DUF2281 domain-containing protein [Oscillatoria sp. PMC 1068.18]|nr:DUF2281 domain-containing protein [Oscillatoria sp. PMC 1076.18]MEC4990453.1 DUF2281 domain-containing protein [Oscillatoria sp. PMC 1068.18]
MKVKDKLIQEIENLPEPILAELLDFLLFLKAKKLNEKVKYMVDESALAKDWLTPEEDEAWKDL